MSCKAVASAQGAQRTDVPFAVITQVSPACRYPVGVDWSEDRHWRCNNNVHPSRHGTYNGITMHPFETVFIKASWHVGEPHLSHYTRWVISCSSP